MRIFDKKKNIFLEPNFYYNFSSIRNTFKYRFQIAFDAVISFIFFQTTFSVPIDIIFFILIFIVML